MADQLRQIAWKVDCDRNRATDLSGALVTGAEIINGDTVLLVCHFQRRNSATGALEDLDLEADGAPLALRVTVRATRDPDADLLTFQDTYNEGYLAAFEDLSAGKVTWLVSFNSAELDALFASTDTATVWIEFTYLTAGAVPQTLFQRQLTIHQQLDDGAAGTPPPTSPTYMTAAELLALLGGVGTTPTLGDTVYGNATPTWAKLSGNTTTTRKFLRQTGTGAVSAAPAWDTLLAGDTVFTATDKLLGRSTAGAGAGEEITCTAAGRALLDDATAANQRTTLGLPATLTANYLWRNNAGATAAELANATCETTNGLRVGNDASLTQWASLAHDGTDARLRTSAGFLTLSTDEGTNTSLEVHLYGKGTGASSVSWHTKGTAGVTAGYISGGDSGTPYFRIEGGSQALWLNYDCGANVVCFGGATSGQTPSLAITGRKTGDSARTATVGISSAQDDCLAIAGTTYLSMATRLLLGLTAPYSTIATRLSAQWAAGDVTNASSRLADLRTTFASTASGTHNQIGIYGQLNTYVNATYTNSGTVQGASLFATRAAVASTDDDGTLAALHGLRVVYGHDSTNTTMAGVTTTCYGLGLLPYGRKGTITTRYDLYIAAALTGGTVTNDWALYSLHDAPSYLTARLLLGTTTWDSDTAKLKVSGSAEVASGDYYYVGAPATNDSWRHGISSGSLVMQKRESGSWVTKATIPATTYGEFWTGAGAMTPCTTAGAATGTKEYGTNDIDLDYFAFDGGATEERVQFVVRMPPDWDLGTIKVKFYWSSATGSTAGDTVEWGIKAGALSDSDAIDAALGTAQVISDTLLADNGGDMQVSGATPALTVGGTPALGDLVVFEVYRNTDGTDDMTEDAWLFGVQIQYSKLNTAVAAW